MKKTLFNKLFIVSILGITLTAILLPLMLKRLINSAKNNASAESIVFSFFLIFFAFILAISLKLCIESTNKYWISDDGKILYKQNIFRKQKQINLENIKIILEIIPFRSTTTDSCYLINESALNCEEPKIKGLIKIEDNKTASILTNEILNKNKHIKKLACSQIVLFNFCFVKKKIAGLLKIAKQKQINLTIKCLNENGNCLEFYDIVSAKEIQVRISLNNSETYYTICKAESVTEYGKPHAQNFVLTKDFKKLKKAIKKQ